MLQKITIYGIEGEIPDVPKLNTIEGHDLPIEEQYFRRRELPVYMQAENIVFDDDGDPIYTDQQLAYAKEELDRCEHGHWVMIKGVPTFFNMWYYYWLTYWTLEDGNRPEHRECDRIFFLFFQFCYRNPFIAGILRGKARREGATSHGTCIEMHIATFDYNKRIGNISKTGPDVSDMFTNMIVYAFKALPIFLRPRTDGPEDPKNEISFKRPTKKKSQKGVADTSRKGLNSIITKRDTTLNSYDSGRWSFILIDEGAKWISVNISKYWNIVKQVLVRGASRVGFAYLPTTVNPPNQGGSNFRTLYNLADQFKYPLNRLPKGLVKYFKPAYDGLSGFIDKYGHSIIEPPDEKTLEFLIQKNREAKEEERIPEEYLNLGAKQYLAYKRSLLEDDDDISEEKRMYPVIESDMFDFGDVISPFSIEKIEAQEAWLKENPQPLRRGDFVYNMITKKVEFQDNKKGFWLLRKTLNDGESNKFSIDARNVCHPLNTHNYGGGADTFRFDNTQELGSKGTIWIGSKLDISKPEEQEGGEPVAFYIGRPKLTEMFWRELLLASLYYGCTITVEKDATQEFIKYFQGTMPNFMQANCLPMLGKKPDIAIDQTRKRNKDKDMGYGASSADPFVFAKQIEIAVLYVYKYCYKIHYPDLLAELKMFDPSNRTQFDQTIGFMMMLLNCMGDFQQRKIEKKKFKLLRYYQKVA